jgi:hypothetical protein
MAAIGIMCHSRPWIFRNVIPMTITAPATTMRLYLGCTLDHMKGIVP